ncbi:MAG: hypothetical protein ACTSO9_14755 [Candidatus Helarchaeota archaeon]
MGAAGFIWWIQYTINEILGISIFNEPWELIGLGILLIAGIFVIILMRTLYLNYKETGAVQTLYFLIAAFFLIIAIITLSIEKLSYSSLGLPQLGDFMAIIALIPSGLAIVCAAAFAFYATFPNHVKSLSSFVIILVFIYIGVLGSAILQGPPAAEVVNFEVKYSIEITFVVYGTLIPILAIGPIVFFYFANRIKEENRPAYIRSSWMGMGLLFFGIGYINEVAPLFPTEFSIPMRIFYVLCAITLYVSIGMPEWFKNKIGWKE